MLHDIGKARPGDHSEVGAEIAADLAERMGFTAEDSRVIVDLVRHHLLLVDTATRRDLEDPATVDYVTSRIDNPETLDLLHALTRADAFATGPAAWSDWRAKLVTELVYKVAMEPAEDGYHLTVAAPDHLGLLSTVAGVLSLQRLQVRSARVITVGERAVQIWTVFPTFGDPPSAEQIAEQLRLAFAGAIDVGAKIRERAVAYVSNGKIVRAAPRVDVIHAVSDRSTILEVRAHDEPGLLHRVTGAISAAEVTITGAKVLALGSEAVDVFFLVGDAAAPLSPPMAEVVRLQVLEALQVG
ncbi:MAG: HD domain-containing protein [Actinobacteria bacterium]|nr:HD domain-containing protein [Actinomycetota bacterium]